MGISDRVDGFRVAGFGGEPIYRCEKDKQIILTDRPCDAQASGAGTGTPVSSNGEVTKSISALPTVVGDWRGQTQSQGTENGHLLQEAHTVVGLTLTFTASLPRTLPDGSRAAPTRSHNFRRGYNKHGGWDENQLCKQRSSQPTPDEPHDSPSKTWL